MLKSCRFPPPAGILLTSRSAPRRFRFVSPALSPSLPAPARVPSDVFTSFEFAAREAVRSNFAPMSSQIHRPFKISVLIFVHDSRGRFLLIQRTKEPNRGLWSPIGGKLEMTTGESPFECAIRETDEEIGVALTERDLHLFAMISEKDYEGTGHWLMFLFECHKPVDTLPPAIDEGAFAFFTREDLKTVPLPETDRTALWPIHERYRNGFVSLRADCDPTRPLEIVIEEAMEKTDRTELSV